MKLSMVAQGTKEIQIDKAFEKGLVQDVWRNKIPQFFAWWIRNARIQNWASTIRKWNRVIWSPAIAWPVQWMVYVDQLYFVSWWNLCSLFGIIGNIWYTWPVNFIVYWPVLIILTWVGNPWVRESNTLSFFQVPDTLMPFLGWAWAYDCPLNPYIGDSFTGFTFFAGNATWYRNVLYISQPVKVNLITNQPEYTTCYKWNSLIPRNSDSAENRAMTSDILGIKANTNNLYIFCKDTIEILGRSSATNVWWIVTLFTQPIADWDQVMNNDCIVSAGNKIFYLTRSLKVRTIWFIPWVVDPAVGDLTDRIYQSIAWFMWEIDNLSSDSAFWIYCKTDNTVRWHLKTIWSSVNNICLIYDLENDCFLVDDNKNYSSMTTGIDSSWNYALYAWDATSVTIYEDDFWWLDVTGIPWIPPYERDSPNIWFWQPNRVKQFRWFTIAGGINQYTTLNFKLYVDGVQIMSQSASFSDISDPNAINIWWPDISSSFALYPFEFVFDEWQVRAKWKKIRLKITASVTPWFSPWFYLDSLSFFVRPIAPYELSDKL